MRTPLCFSLVIFSALTARCFAQIPNGGFEDWVPLGFYSDPAGWTTDNGLTFPLLGCSQGTPGEVGNYYARVTTHIENGTALPGLLFVGTTAHPGFPFTQRPPALNGEWQYYMQSGDVGAIVVELTRWNTLTIQRDTIGSAQWFFSGIFPQWSAFTIPITYTSMLDPDTAFISITSSAGLSPGNGSNVWVDALAFETTTGADELSAGLGIELRPSLTDSRITVTAHSPIAEVALLDMSGRELERRSSDGGPILVDVSRLPTGTYLARVRLADGRSAVRAFVKD